LQLGFSAGFETIALNIEAEAVMSKLSAIIGFPPNKPIRFEVDPKFDPRRL
jgi:hypothetical protein